MHFQKLQSFPAINREYIQSLRDYRLAAWYGLIKNFPGCVGILHLNLHQSFLVKINHIVDKLRFAVEAQQFLSFFISEEPDISQMSLVSRRGEDRLGWNISAFFNPTGQRAH